MNNFSQHSKNYFFDIKIKQPKFDKLYLKYKSLIRKDNSIDNEKEIELENNEIQNKIIEILLKYIVAPIIMVLFALHVFSKNFFSAVMKDVYSRIVGFIALLIFTAILYFVFNLFN